MVSIQLHPTRETHKARVKCLKENPSHFWGHRSVSDTWRLHNSRLQAQWPYASPCLATVYDSECWAEGGNTWPNFQQRVRHAFNSFSHFSMNYICSRDPRWCWPRDMQIHMLIELNVRELLIFNRNYMLKAEKRQIEKRKVTLELLK